MWVASHYPLTKNEIKKTENKITELEKDVSWKDKLIDKLQVEKQKFEDLYYKFSGFWHSIIKRFQGMIGYYDDKNYKNVAKDLYEHDVIDIKEYEIYLIEKKIKNLYHRNDTGKSHFAID